MIEREKNLSLSIHLLFSYNTFKYRFTLGIQCRQIPAEHIAQCCVHTSDVKSNKFVADYKMKAVIGGNKSLAHIILWECDSDLLGTVNWHGLTNIVEVTLRKSSLLPYPQSQKARPTF